MKTPEAIGIRRRREILELELVVRNSVQEVNTSLLSSHRIRQSTHRREKSPFSVSRVTTIQVETSHSRSTRVIVVLNLNHVHPFTTIIVQSERNVVRTSGTRVGGSIIAIESVCIGTANTRSGYGEIPYVSFRFIRHQTNSRIKVCRHLTRERKQTNRDHVGTLLQQSNRIRSILIHKATRKSQGMILHFRIRFSRRRRRTDCSISNVVTECLVSIHIHHTTILVTNVQNQSRHHTQITHTKCLLVQLNLIRRSGERSLVALSPARRVVIIPIRRHVSHLIVPLLANGDGFTTQPVSVVVVLIIIKTSLQNQILLVVSQNSIHIDVRVRTPERRRTIHSHIESIHSHTQIVNMICIRRVRVTNRNLHQQLIRNGVANTEGFITRNRLVGTKNTKQSSLTLGECEGNGSSHRIRSSTTRYRVRSRTRSSCCCSHDVTL